ncbi:hypothetical protein ICW40_05530, partial [Actinotalea ferrariae]|uniref:hypothetical protein n=1 Tax=Actinotalea ferrariae TaxID=1386098 RepID=UPI001C8B9F34
MTRPLPAAIAGVTTAVTRPGSAGRVDAAAPSTAARVRARVAALGGLALTASLLLLPGDGEPA